MGRETCIFLLALARMGFPLRYVVRNQISKGVKMNRGEGGVQTMDGRVEGNTTLEKNSHGKSVDQFYFTFF